MQVRDISHFQGFVRKGPDPSSGQKAVAEKPARPSGRGRDATPAERAILKSIRNTSRHRVCRPVEGYTPQGCIVRWRHCYWDENGYFIQPVSQESGRSARRVGNGGVVITTLAPTRVLRELSKKERDKIHRHRKRYLKAIEIATRGFLPHWKEGGT